jgi:hypothetical protein
LGAADEKRRIETVFEPYERKTLEKSNYASIGRGLIRGSLLIRQQNTVTLRRRYVFHVFGYVIMPEHVYMMVSEPTRGLLNRTIQILKVSVSKLSTSGLFG